MTAALPAGTALGRRLGTMAAVEAATEKITVTLPDGKPLELPGGATGADAAAAIGPGLAKAALAIKVGGELRDLDGAAARRRRDRDRHRPLARGAGADPPRRRPRDGRGGARPLSRDQGDDRAADRVRLLLRLRVPARYKDHRGRPRQDREGDAGPHRGRRELRPPRRPGGEAIELFRAPGPGLQGRADRRPGRAKKASRPSRSTATASSRTSAAARTVPRPAGSRRSSSTRSPAPTGAATRTARA